VDDHKPCDGSGVTYGWAAKVGPLRPVHVIAVRLTRPYQLVDNTLLDFGATALLFECIILRFVKESLTFADARAGLRT